ncbi:MULTISPECIES: GNAT family N-acetyltransferase [unclassified Salipiger]|uniref:GNAT family N-acetyltransferase n=1 Tax=unclassified Salipiger TaxID=2640570 RepID=UPI0013BD00B3|nr:MULTISPECIES: GNAT family protein [unclassified Salipiger]NDV48243.1 GNAT family N-acetyltransferase [Salipiger sp. PrR003]NDW35471.1 GNAT family N-acetyltransferase [Salipiger sp. PrR007]
MLGRRRKFRLDSERLILRPPLHGDFNAWVALRLQSKEYLTPWEPSWAEDHLSRRAFTNRVYWAQRSINAGSAVPLFIVRREDQLLIGAITLDNIRRGPAQSGTLGYWTGQPFSRHGYMREAIAALVHHAFTAMDLSRIEAACLPENVPSRGLLESSGFKYEGVAQSYLQINGRWRTHVLYSALRLDRRGRTQVG